MHPLRWAALGLALAIGSIPSPARAAEQAGVAAAVRGQVMLARASIPARDVLGGEEIFMRDGLRSGLRSGMQILLLDETVFTIGPESELVVDEFVYDPATSAGKIGATVAKGVFRFVTGKIAKKQPSDMNVALPSGNIGVRGTIVAGRTDGLTRASLVILLGDSRSAPAPGPASIEVCNAGACERVATPGFGVTIDGPDAAPSPPFRVADGDLDAILQALGDPEGIGTAGGGDGLGPLDAAGLPLRDGDRAREIRRKLQGLDALDAMSDRAAQDARTAPHEAPIVPPAPPVPTGSVDLPGDSGPKGGYSHGP
jgi:hypothetical protein